MSNTDKQGKQDGPFSLEEEVEFNEWMKEKFPNGVGYTKEGEPVLIPALRGRNWTLMFSKGEEARGYSENVKGEDWRYSSEAGRLFIMRCLALEVGFYATWDKGDPKLKEFRELEDMGVHVWKYETLQTSTPPAREAKTRKSYSLEEVEAIVSGKSKTSPQKLGPFPFQVWKFLRTLEELEKKLSGIAKKKKQEAEVALALDELRTVAKEAARLILPQKEPTLYATRTFQYVTNALETCRLILRLDELPAPRETGVIRMAKTVNDHLLRRQGHRQPTLFEELDNEWQAAISNTKGGAEIKAGGGIIAGVELEPEENALIDALYVMLHYQSSNTVEPKSEDYYSGGYEVAGKTALRFTATELARVYNGGKKPSGDEMARLKEVIENLEERRFMIEYEEEVSRNGKKPIKRSVKAYAPLFEVREEKLTEGGKSATSSFIVLHELLRASIASRYIELPEDIRARMRQAFGKASYTDYQLRNYLLNEVSAKRREATINRETAYERFTRPDTRPARQRELLNKALEGCKRLGLLASYEETTGKGGQLKLILNPALDWSRKPMPMLENGK